MNTSRISISTGGMMIAFAVLIDLAQFGLDVAFIGFLLDTLVSIVVGMIFGMWFSHVGVSLLGPNRVLKSLGTFVVELIPGMDGFLPGWTFLVASTVITERRSEPEL